MAAATALPGVFSPVTIGERRYIDGIVRSATNADLAAGYDRVLVLAPVPEIRDMPGGSLREALEQVEAKGSAFVIVPDDAAREAIGKDLTDLSRRAGAARAGQAQGASIAGAVNDFWLT